MIRTIDVKSRTDPDNRLTAERFGNDRSNP